MNELTITLYNEKDGKTIRIASARLNCIYILSSHEEIEKYSTESYCIKG